MFYTNPERLASIVLESSVAQIIKSTERLSKGIKAKSWETIQSLLSNPSLQYEDVKVFAPEGLRDSEVRALELFCIVYRESLAAWKIQECLELEVQHSRNPQLALLLSCKSLSEAIYRLSNIDQSLLTKIHRNYKDNLQTGLRKLRVIRVRNKKPTRPIRRKGYNDKGSIDPDSAWKHARAFWLDDELQREIEKRRKEYLDCIDFLDGFTQ